jgi:hypothetical protein
VPDLLDRIRSEIRERRDVSRQAALEFERLEEALRALTGGGAEADRAVGGSPPRPRRSTSTAGDRQANRERLLAAIGDRPGITRQHLREATGLSAAGVAQLLRRLVEQGAVRERELPAGQLGYALAEGAE